MMQNREENEMNLFACPSCGTDVSEDAKECPGCNAQFEENGKSQPKPPNEERLLNDPQKGDQIIYPPPPDWKEPKQGDPQPLDDGEKPSSTSKEASDKNENNPLEVKEFNGKLINEDGEDKEEREDEPDKKSNSDESISDDEDPKAISDSNIPDTVDSQHSEDMMELKKLDDRINLHNEILMEENLPENRVMAALKEYNTNRRKRYFTGTMFIGLGVILFVLLWLVVIYEVLVNETQVWFGAHVIMILVVAGMFFTFGLYMILTYPKSSLLEILTYMTQAKNKKKTTEL
jgi:hypothetical protein